MNIKTHKHLKTPRALSRTLSDNFSAAAKNQNISPELDLKYSMFFGFIAADMQTHTYWSTYTAPPTLPVFAPQATFH